MGPEVVVQAQWCLGLQWGMPITAGVHHVSLLL
jgi:hypothetical protein